MSVEAAHVRVSEVDVTALEAKPVGAEGAVVSGGVSVVTDSPLEALETLPAASSALTVKV